MKKIMLVILIIILVLGIFYFYLWLASNKQYPVEYGISFNKQHAESLGLDWKDVYLAMVNELKPKYVRIAAAWDEVEKELGAYDFEDVDWQVQVAAREDVKVTLVVGQKAPRWPECHVPGWVNDLSGEEYKEALFDYIAHAVNRYKDMAALEIWQVENEPFIKFRFGECQYFEEELVKEEISLVKSLDQQHKVMITDSGELSTWRKASRAGDIFATTLYRIVRSPSGRIWTYDWLPPAFYRVKAKFWGKEPAEVFVSELQAEPWFTDSDPNSASIAEQEKTMNPERLQKHFDYVEKIGFPRAYLWGVEWWYWIKEFRGDESYWEMVKEKLVTSN